MSRIHLEKTSQMEPFDSKVTNCLRKESPKCNYLVCVRVHVHVLMCRSMRMRMAAGLVSKRLRVWVLALTGWCCVCRKVGSSLDFFLSYPGAKWVPEVFCWGSEPGSATASRPARGWSYHVTLNATESWLSSHSLGLGRLEGTSLNGVPQY